MVKVGAALPGSFSLAARGREMERVRRERVSKSGSGGGRVACSRFGPDGRRERERGGRERERERERQRENERRDEADEKRRACGDERTKRVKRGLWRFDRALLGPPLPHDD